MVMSSIEKKSCPNCFTEGVTILERKDTFHLDQGIFYQVYHVTYVCKKGCWHNWTEYYRMELKDFNLGDFSQIPFEEEEIITPDKITFKKE